MMAMTKYGFTTWGDCSNKQNLRRCKQRRMAPTANPQRSTHQRAVQCACELGLDE